MMICYCFILIIRKEAFHFSFEIFHIHSAKTSGNSLDGPWVKIKKELLPFMAQFNFVLYNYFLIIFQLNLTRHWRIYRYIENTKGCMFVISSNSVNQ